VTALEDAGRFCPAHPVHAHVHDDDVGVRLVHQGDPLLASLATPVTS